MDCDGPKHSLVRDLDGRFVGTFPTEGSVVPFAELRYYTKIIMDYHSNSLALSTDFLITDTAYLPRGWLA